MHCSTGGDKTSLMDLKSKANAILEGIEGPERSESTKVEGVSGIRDSSLLILLSMKEVAKIGRAHV